MTIHPAALKAARMKAGLTRQGLVDKCRQSGSRRSISEKTISRYETGRSRPSFEKAKWLAECLGTTVEALNKDPKDVAASESSLRDQGYRQIRLRLRPEVVRNYEQVGHHYGVSVTNLVDATPWMFTLLAEMSLADRKQRLAEASTAFEEALTHLPNHLRNGVPAWRAADFDESYSFSAEKASIADRDIFGKKLLGSDDGPDYDPFDPDETNPFVDFVRRKASEIASDAIDVEECEFWRGRRGGLPGWPVFEAWLQELVAGDSLAECAIERGHVKLSAIPQELLSPEKRDERVAWLIDQIPDDERARLVEERERRVKSSEGLV